MLICVRVIVKLLIFVCECVSLTVCVLLGSYMCRRCGACCGSVRVGVLCVVCVCKVYVIVQIICLVFVFVCVYMFVRLCVLNVCSYICFVCVLCVYFSVCMRMGCGVCMVCM